MKIRPRVLRLHVRSKQHSPDRIGSDRIGASQVFPGCAGIPFCDPEYLSAVGCPEVEHGIDWQARKRRDGLEMGSPDAAEVMFSYMEMYRLIFTHTHIVSYI